MKFIYLGCDGAPEVSEHFGVSFTIGKPSEVSDESAIEKLRNHKHFRAVVLDASPAESSAIEERDEKGELIYALSGHGIRADRRSSVERLRELLREAENADND